MDALQIENLKDIVAGALLPEEVNLINVEELVKGITDEEVAREIVHEEISHQIRIKGNDGFYKPIYRTINKMKVNCCNVAFIKGKCAIGKSFSIRRALKLARLDYVEITGKVTAAYLYELLYKNNGKVIWLKDLSTLLSGAGNLNLLKAATEMEKDKVLTNNSYSLHLQRMPQSFKFTGKILFDYNEVLNNFKSDFEALVSRGDYIQLVFSSGQMEEILRNVAKNEKELETTEFCIKHTDPEALNLRVQQKAFMTRKYAESSRLVWQNEVNDELRKYKGKTFYQLYDVMGEQVITTLALKKKLINAGIVNSLRSADRKVHEYEFNNIIKKVNKAQRNYEVKLNW